MNSHKIFCFAVTLHSSVYQYLGFFLPLSIIKPRPKIKFSKKSHFISYITTVSASVVAHPLVTLMERFISRCLILSNLELFLCPTESFVDKWVGQRLLA